MNFVDSDNRTALMCAAEKCNTSMVLSLLKAGGDVNSTDDQGNTALILAPKNNPDVNCLKCVKLLISKGKINLFNEENHNELTAYIAHSKRLPNFELCMFLYAAGERVKGKPLPLRLVPQYLQNLDLKLCLKHLCREAIRDHLLNLDPHTHLFGRIPQTGLPKPLVKFLLFDVLSEEDDIFLLGLSDNPQSDA